MAGKTAKKVAMKQTRHLVGDALDYPASLVGSTANVDVYLADELIPGAEDLGRAVLSGVEADYQALSDAWGGVSVARPSVIIAPLSSGNDGSGGAYHYGCDGVELYADADLADDGATTLALFVAELSEVFQAAAGTGWDCGGSNGEGLSRCQAEVAHPYSLDGYSTVAAWLDGDRPDWVNNTDPTDGSAESTGCAVLFLFWVNVVKSKSWAEICAAGAPTLAGTYSALGLGNDAFGDFSADCEARWPKGQPSNVTVDNPWSSAGPPPPPPPCTIGTLLLDRMPVLGELYAITLIPPGAQGAAGAKRKP